MIVRLSHWECRFYIRSEVTNNVDDEEDSTLLRLHGQITSSRVATDGMIVCGFDEEIENSLGRSEDVACGIRGEGKNEDNKEQHHSMDIICEEGRFDATKHGVNDHTNWK